MTYYMHHARVLFSGAPNALPAFKHAFFKSALKLTSLKSALKLTSLKSALKLTKLTQLLCLKIHKDIFTVKANHLTFLFSDAAGRLQKKEILQIS